MLDSLLQISNNNKFNQGHITQIIMADETLTPLREKLNLLFQVVLSL